MNYLIKNFPDFARQREEVLKGLEFPCPFYSNPDEYITSVRNLESTASYLNEIIKVYGNFFPYDNSFENFENLILPWVLKMADEKVLARDVKARWIAAHQISIQLNGDVKLNSEKELQFLLDSVQFPAKIDEVTKKLFALIRNCRIPNLISYRDLWRDELQAFGINEKIKEKLLEDTTKYCPDEKHLKLHMYTMQLCDALNGLHSLGFGLIGPIPRQIEMLLVNTTDPQTYSTKGRTFAFDPNKIYQAKRQAQLNHSTFEQQKKIILNQE